MKKLLLTTISLFLSTSCDEKIKKENERLKAEIQAIKKPDSAKIFERIYSDHARRSAIKILDSLKANDPATLKALGEITDSWGEAPEREKYFSEE